MTTGNAALAKFFHSVSNVSMLLTDRCNLRCSYCFIDCTPANDSTMPLETAKQIAHLLIENSGYPQVALHLYGGEPLLMDDSWIADFVAYARALGEKHGKEVIFPLSTNGTLLDEERLVRLHEMGIGFSLSCDGPPALHNACRERGEQLHELLQSAKKRGIPVGVVVTINRHNAGRMGEVMEYLREQGVAGMISNFVVAQGRGDAEQLSAEQMFTSTVDEIGHMLKSGMSVDDMRVGRMAYQYLAATGNRNGSQPQWNRSCDSAADKIGIDGEGNIFVCGGTRNKEYLLGRLDEIDEKHVQRLRDNFPKKGTWYIRCFDCAANRFCTHGCPISCDLSESFRDNHCRFTKLMWNYFNEQPDTARRVHEMTMQKMQQQMKPHPTGNAGERCCREAGAKGGDQGGTA
ncbi:radical SAM protein [Geomonas sp. Red32]|uniref:radical SAM protein n=1 Tax=Geomonas sp. Red32 TaxID=2912856 RepID=UPI00202CD5BA|nr:radical SAM protein [Geomonas sp. Red32]MCM0080535.1 radical SAM protein [Geomonas sp. Red32]